MQNSAQKWNLTCLQCAFDLETIGTIHDQFKFAFSSKIFEFFFGFEIRRIAFYSLCFFEFSTNSQAVYLNEVLNKWRNSHHWTPFFLPAFKHQHRYYHKWVYFLTFVYFTFTLLVLVRGLQITIFLKWAKVHLTRGTNWHYNSTRTTDN